MFDLSMPLCIYALLPGFFVASLAPVIHLVSTIWSIVCWVRSVMEYLFSGFVLVLGLITSFLLAVFFCQFAQTMLRRIPTGRFVLRHLEKRIKGQLKALSLEQRKATDLVRQYLEAIGRWDGANAKLMTEIRDAEAKIGKRALDWEVVPERDPRSKTAGSTYFVHGPFSQRPLEVPEPSPWIVVRWWRGEEDPRLWAGKGKLTHQNGVLSDKRAVLARLEQENQYLTAKRDEVNRRQNSSQWGPFYTHFKPRKDKWAENQFGIMNHSIAAYQHVEAQPQPDCFRSEVVVTDERIHYCEFCTKNGHRWRHQYESFACAEAAPFIRACPPAAARLRIRPACVSAVPLGAPSFFAPDFPAAFPDPPHGVPAPAPLCAVPSFPPSGPLFPAVLATPAPAQATSSHFSAVPLQPSDPKLSVPGAASLFPAAPHPTLATASSAPSAAPVVKIAAAAPSGKGPPSALQIVWPGQAVTGASSASGPVTGSTAAGRSSFATTFGLSSATAPTAPAQPKAILTHEQAVDALVKEEAMARAAEKKAAAEKKKEELSAPRVEKKDYRFG